MRLKKHDEGERMGSMRDTYLRKTRLDINKTSAGNGGEVDFLNLVNGSHLDVYTP